MRVNEDVQGPEVRVIGQDGEIVGVLAIEKAIETAKNEGMDLVEVSPNSNPPVCKIMDYGKYQYQQNKRDKKKPSNVIKTKELRLRPSTDKHDVNTKIRQASKFLIKGMKVKFVVVFKGRENAHPELGVELLHNISNSLWDVAEVDKDIEKEGANLLMVLAPKS